MFYSSFGIFALIVHAIINQSVLTAKKKSDGVTAKVRYKHFLLCMTVFYVADIAWGFLFDLKIVPLVYADTVIFFMTMAASVFLWTKYVVAYIGRRSVFSTVLQVAGWALLVFEAVALAVNFFTPVMFRFSPDGEYFPNDARYITLASQIALFFVTAVYSLAVTVKPKGKEKRPFRTICVSGLVMTLFVVLQMFYPLLPFYAVGCLIASCLIHSFVSLDEKNDRSVELGSAKKQAYTDSLTGIRNYHAYAEEMGKYEDEIEKGTLGDFGIIVLDLNGLKEINDTKGHDVGDEYIIKACRIICKIFAHSPVFRIGGDEFAVLLRGEDFMNRTALLGELNATSRANVETGDVVIAAGMAEYDEEDGNISATFRRADQAMYEIKRELKQVKTEKAE